MLAFGEANCLQFVVLHRRDSGTGYLRRHMPRSLKRLPDRLNRLMPQMVPEFHQAANGYFLGTVYLDESSDRHLSTITLVWRF
jgi:hypothetical protein